MAGPPKVLLSLDEDLKVRMVKTLERTRGTTRIASQQEFIRVAIGRFCDYLEDELNGGKPFEELPTENAAFLARSRTVR